MRSVVWPAMRLTGRPPPTARTGELPRRSPISGGQAAESRRGARGGRHSSSRGTAKSRRGGRGGRDAPDNRVHGGDLRRPGGARRPAAAAPAACRTSASPPAGPPRRRPPARRRVACPAAPRGPRRRRRRRPRWRRVAAADAPADRPRSAARSAADLPPRTRHHAPRRGGHAAGRRPDTAPAGWREISPEPVRGSRAPHSPTAAMARPAARATCSALADRRDAALRGPRALHSPTAALRSAAPAWGRAARARRHAVRGRYGRARPLWRTRQPHGADAGPLLPGSAPDRSRRHLRVSAAEI